MLRVIRNHRRAAYGATSGYEGLASPRWRSTMPRCTDPRLVDHARAAWDRALELGEAHGYRNAQATVIAPTGTIGLVMDCDTTGIEPDFALVKFKKLAGGGYFKIINRAVPEALRALGYGEAEIAEITPMRSATRRSRRRPASTTRRCARAASRTRRSPPSRRTSPAPSTSSSCSTNGRSGEDFLTGTLKVPAEKLGDPSFELLVLPGLPQGERSRRRTSMCAAP